MKYTTFVKMRGFIVVALCALLCLNLWSGCRARQETANKILADVSREAEQSTPAAPSAPAYPSGPTAKPKGSKPIAASPAGKPTVTGTADFTDIHREILKLQKSPLSKGEDKGDSLRWVVSDNGIKAEFRSDKSKGSTTWNRVKVDYNNNKQYEEKWDFKPDGSIKRQVAPSDDNNYTEEYRLQGEKWVRK